MREKYETIALTDLREIAKSRGIKGVSTMKKADIIEAMLAEDEKAKISPEKLSDELDSGETASGILEVMPDGFGFIRCENYLPGENDVYVAPSQIRKFNLKTGDIIEGNTRVKTQNEKFSALLYLKKINGYHPSEAVKRMNFENMTPIFPDERLKLETPGASVAMRIMDLMSPVGKGQRGMIVSPPKAGKTTLLKEVAKSVKHNNPDMHLIILLIDERPEEVTDIREAIEGPNVEVIYSTFDELPEHHKRVAEMVIERAKRLVEHKKDVMILLDSITRLTRAYNLTVPASGRTNISRIFSTASSGFNPLRALRMILMPCISSGDNKRSSLRVPDLGISIAGNTLFSDSLRSSTISILPVPLNSSYTTPSENISVCIPRSFLLSRNINTASGIAPIPSCNVEPSSINEAQCSPIFFSTSVIVGRLIFANFISEDIIQSNFDTCIKLSPYTKGICSFISAITNLAFSAAALV